MIYKLDDFYSGNTVFSSKEEQFKDNIKSKYDLNIRQTWKASRSESEQFHLYVWIDLPDGWKIERMLGIRNTQFDIVCSNQEIMMLYLEIFGISQNNHKEFFVEIHDYHQSLVSYAYGHAILAIREYIHKYYHCEQRNVCLNYAGPDIVVIGNQKQCKTWNKHKKSITEICFKQLQEFDELNELTPADVRVTFLDKDKTDPIMLNDIYITNGI